MIEIKIDDKEVQELLKKLAAKGSNLTPVMQVIGQTIRASVLKNFEVGGRPAWKKSLRADMHGGQTLVDSSNLKNSINVKASGNRVEVGTNKIYAAIHQFGGRITAKNKPYLKFMLNGKFVSKKEVNIPARPFLLVQDEDIVEIKSVIENYLTEGL